MRALDGFDRFFTELYDACEAMDIPAQTAISEAGIGQFEIDLAHQPDAMKAADDAVYQAKNLGRNQVRGARESSSCADEPHKRRLSA